MLEVAPLLDQGRPLADTLPHVIHPRTHRDRFTIDLNLFNIRAVDRKNPLNTDPRGNPTNRKGLVDPTPLARNHDPRKNLNPLLVAFTDTGMHPDTVTNLKVGAIGLNLFLGELLDDRVHGKFRWKKEESGLPQAVRQVENRRIEPQSKIHFSTLGNRFRAGGGIVTLMDDLGRALREGGDLHMLGGGNPAPIPAGRQLWRRLMQEMLDEDGDRFDRMLGNYDTQQGNDRFIEAVVGFFRRECGWNLSRENVAITNGGQSAFFYLFNLLAGPGDDGTLRRILFPLAPEYIGYEGLAITPESVVAHPARIQLLGDRFFKYRIDFDALPLDPSIRIACVSRPTNPSSNVLTDDEIRQLHARCRANGTLLVIDNAYGTPFPDMVFGQATPFWDEGVILTYSLSKLGLPGTRTGIVIGPPEVSAAVSAMNAVAGLATGTIGQGLTTTLFESGEIRDFSRDCLRPFYSRSATDAVSQLLQAFQGLPLRIHQPEGALFLWLWFPDLPIHSAELYERFKAAGVLVVPGHFFFHGTEHTWKHATECVRINHALDREGFPEAARRIAQVIREIYPPSANTD